MPAGWSPAVLVLIAGAAVSLVLAAACLPAYLAVAPAPRRKRAYARARAALAAGRLGDVRQAAVDLARTGPLDRQWQGKHDNLLGEAARAAGEAALSDGRFEDALTHLRDAATLLGTKPAEADARVGGAALAAARDRLLVGNAAGLLGRVRALVPGNAEAAFWLGYDALVRGDVGDAEGHFRTAAAEAPRSGEPSLYLGGLLLRAGRHAEAVAALAEADRRWPDNPLIAWQLGEARLATGDLEGAFAVLKRAAGPGGLPDAAPRGEQFWAVVLPAGAFVRTFASEHPHADALFGPTPAVVARRARMALAECLLRLGRPGEAAATFEQVLAEGPPAPAILRGLGLAYSRLGRFGDAFARLKPAHDAAGGPDPLLSAHLAHAAARGRAATAADKANNVLWALHLLASDPPAASAETAVLLAGVLDEADAAGVTPTPEGLRICCDVFAEAGFAGKAAATCAALPASFRRPEHAWHFARAAALGATHPDGRACLEAAFADPDGGRAFFDRHGWGERGWAEAERHFLAGLVADNASLPESFGRDYPTGARARLLTLSGRQEADGDAVAARQTAELAVRLFPAPEAFDALARLEFRAGATESAASRLVAWREMAPDDPTPLTRLALVERSCGRHAEAADAAGLAAERAGTAAARFLAGRLALSAGRGDEAGRWFRACLEADPEHADARAALACVLWQRRDTAGLATLADGPEPTDARSRYLAAVCHLAAGSSARALELALAAADDPALAADARHLAALVRLGQGEPEAAEDDLWAAAEAGGPGTADHARLWLGRLALEADADVAAGHWLAVAPALRAAWGVTPALPGALVLAAEALAARGEWSSAAARLAEASALGWVGDLSGPRSALLLRAAETSDLDRAAGLLETAPGPSAALRLADVRRRQGRLADAHALLACLPESAPAALLAGSLALGEGDAAAAEAEFDRACRLDPSSWPATANRALARLSLGRGSEDVRSAGAWAPAEESGWWTTLAAAWEGAPLPEGIADADVSRAAGVLVGLGRPVEALAALRRLAEVRPGSEVVRRAVADAVLLVALEHLNAGDWLGAERELAALARTDPSPTTLNLWGCAAALGQDFAGAAKTFQAALRAGEDARMWHNLALAREWAGENAAALAAWRRLLDALQADRADSRRQFAVAGRAAGFAERARQDGVAIEFWERAVRLRPDEIGLVERLFVLYHRSGRTTEAKAALRRLRNLRPKEGRWLVYEAELLPLERAGDLDEVFPVLERLREALAGDRKLADAVVGRLLPGFEALADRVKTRFKRLRSDADDDPEEMDLRALRQLRKDAQRLRQAVERCLRFTLRPALQTRLDELDDELDRRVAACLRWEEGS